MKKLILHIGTHKTGSTSIQVSLDKNMELQKKGYSLFKKRSITFEGTKGNTSSWIESTKENIYQSATINKNLAYELSKLSGHVIMSAENFSWVFSQDEIQKFKDQLCLYFDEIKIICYIRRQDTHSISLQQQVSKGPLLSAGAFFYGQSCNAIPLYKKEFDNYFNHYERLMKWSNVFGIESMNIRIFEKSYLYKSCVVADFYQFLGLNIEYEVERKNESYGFEKTKLNLVMNKLNLDGYLRYCLNRDLNNDGKMLPARKDALAFYERYEKSNIALNNVFKLNGKDDIFNNDFSKYPIVAGDLWNEESADAALIQLLSSFNKLIKPYIVLLRQINRVCSVLGRLRRFIRL
jgi:hypothetical protein